MTMRECIAESLKERFISFALNIKNNKFVSSPGRRIPSLNLRKFTNQLHSDTY